MPRYYVCGYYCWADNVDQALDCMVAYWTLLDKTELVRHAKTAKFSVFKSAEQKYCRDEPDFSKRLTHYPRR